MPSPHHRFLSPEAVAEILGVTLEQIEELIDSGELLALRVGRHGPWRVDIAVLQQFIDDSYESARRQQMWFEANMANVSELADGRLI